MTLDLTNLLESKEQVHALFENAPLAICMIEMPERRYIAANERYCRLFQNPLSSGEIAGKKVEEILLNPNSEAIAAIENAHQYNKSTHFGVISSAISGDRITHWTGVVLPMLRNEKRTIALALLIEITDKIEAEQQARQRQIELEKERHKLNAFVAQAVHELRTPITSLLIASQILQRSSDNARESKPSKPIEVGAMYKMIEQQATQLSRLINDLGESTRIENNKLELTLIETSIQDLVSQVAGDFARLTPNRSVLVQLRGSPLTRVAIDSGRFIQVLSNLLDNAAKYSGDESEIRVACEECGDIVRISVSDDGIGLLADQLERVFFQFYQGQTSKGGLGLGLYLSRELTSRMGGRIWAESAGKGKGSTFFIELMKVKAEKK